MWQRARLYFEINTEIMASPTGASADVSWQCEQVLETIAVPEDWFNTRHSTAQHSTAQHSTAQHSTAQHISLPDRANSNKQCRLYNLIPLICAQTLAKLYHSHAIIMADSLTTSHHLPVTKPFTSPFRKPPTPLLPLKAHHLDSLQLRCYL